MAKIIAIVGCSVNFAVYRMLSSRYRNLKEFNAVFADEPAFYRSLILSSFVHMLTVSVPIMVAGSYGIWYLEIGYQLHMFCFEIVIIEFFLLMFMTIELF